MMTWERICAEYISKEMCQYIGGYFAHIFSLINTKHSRNDIVGWSVVEMSWYRIQNHSFTTFDFRALAAVYRSLWSIDSTGDLTAFHVSSM